MSDEIDSESIFSATARGEKLTTIGVTNEILDMLKIYKDRLSDELKFTVNNRQAISHMIRTALEEKDK
jgi:hypothetical protein